MPQFNLEGEEGYVLVQSSMMRYSGDQEIMQNMQQAMLHVQSKAGAMMWREKRERRKIVGESERERESQI